MPYCRESLREREVGIGVQLLVEVLLGWHCLARVTDGSRPARACGTASCVAMPGRTRRGERRIVGERRRGRSAADPPPPLPAARAPMRGAERRSQACVSTSVRSSPGSRGSAGSRAGTPAGDRRFRTRSARLRGVPERRDHRLEQVLGDDRSGRGPAHQPRRHRRRVADDCEQASARLELLEPGIRQDRRRAGQHDRVVLRVPSAARAVARFEPRVANSARCRASSCASACEARHRFRRWSRPPTARASNAVR